MPFQLADFMPLFQYFFSSICSVFTTNNNVYTGIPFSIFHHFKITFISFSFPFNFDAILWNFLLCLLFTFYCFYSGFHLCWGFLFSSISFLSFNDLLVFWCFIISSLTSYIYLGSFFFKDRISISQEIIRILCVDASSFVFMSFSFAVYACMYMYVCLYVCSFLAITYHGTQVAISKLVFADG